MSSLKSGGIKGRTYWIDRPGACAVPERTRTLRTLVTGGSGFIGRYLVRRLQSASSEVVSLDSSCDLTQGSPPLPLGPFDAVFHLAGKAHRTPRSSAQHQAFFDVNVEGTRRLLEHLERSSPRTPIVHISTVAVYGRSAGSELTEAEPVRADDAYGKSKAQAEDLVRSWEGRTGRPATILRLPLVIGANAPGNFGRMVHALRSGYYTAIGDGQARRSMVLAADVADLAVHSVGRSGTYHLTDGIHPSLRELEDVLCRRLGRRSPPRLSMTLARALGMLGDGARHLTRRDVPFDSTVLERLTSTLTFSDQVARRKLSWTPTPVLAAISELPL